MGLSGGGMGVTLLGPVVANSGVRVHIHAVGKALEGDDRQRIHP